MGDEKRMRLRYAGQCRICDVEIAARTEAVYERATKTVRCVDHEDSPAHVDAVDVDPAVVDVGTAGGSARREFERRRDTREKRIRENHPRLGGLILALSDDPASTRAWDTGAVGEERLGARLDGELSEACRVLHDRRIPGSRANIDHLAVTASGVWVIDAKRYKGRPQLRVEGGLLRPRVEKLVVGSRDCTKLVDGMHRQVDVVRAALAGDVPVHGALCFVDADWPLIGGAFTTRGVEVLWPKKLLARLRSDGTLDGPAIADLHRRLAAALPSA